MKLSDSKHKLTCFVFMTLFPCYNFQADLVLIKIGLYWPNFSLVFLIHLFLYAGVYCSTDCDNNNHNDIDNDNDNENETENDNNNDNGNENDNLSWIV